MLGGNRSHALGHHRRAAARVGRVGRPHSDRTLGEGASREEESRSHGPLGRRRGRPAVLREQKGPPMTSSLERPLDEA
jgi:hypothetical protein